MDFFSAQEHAQRATRRLILLYAAATIAVAVAVAVIIGGSLFAMGKPAEVEMLTWLSSHIDSLIGLGIATLVFIGFASLYKIATLRAGGSRVAHDLGATPLAADTTDPLRQRLQNVVEEMAIASGTPVPAIYVLEQESSINAFAAGFSPADAVVAVTRGTLDRLDRDELRPDGHPPGVRHRVALAQLVHDRLLGDAEGSHAIAGQLDVDRLRALPERRDLRDVGDLGRTTLDLLR